jgi:hypothetical protein
MFCLPNHEHERRQPELVLLNGEKVKIEMFMIKVFRPSLSSVKYIHKISHHGAF